MNTTGAGAEGRKGIVQLRLPLDRMDVSWPGKRAEGLGVKGKMVDSLGGSLMPFAGNLTLGSAKGGHGLSLTVLGIGAAVGGIRSACWGCSSWCDDGAHERRDRHHKHEHLHLVWWIEVDGGLMDKVWG